MASLRQDSRNGRYHVLFRYGGRQFRRSLNTTQQREAKAIRGRIEETLALLQRGRLEMPIDADPALFILSDGKVSTKPIIERKRTLGELLDLYQTELIEGVKEATTRATEDIHIDHLKRILKTSRIAQSMTTADLQQYVRRRLREKYQGSPIRPTTARKEVATFRAIWNWCKRNGYVTGDSPTTDLEYPKEDQPPPFMTWEEIERTVERGGLKTQEIAELWECLYLSTGQINQLLNHVNQVARHPFIHPMFVFVAHTGARRSELLRFEIDDFDFDGGTVQIREKKRSRKSSLTFRRVPLTPLLRSVMRQWFSNHPGGRRTLSQLSGRCQRQRTFVPKPVTVNEATNHFKRTLRSSEWERVRGFHVFRHSFASNAASRGVDQRMIDEWLGHQTEAMRLRYRHLFPNSQQEALSSIFQSTDAA